MVNLLAAGISTAMNSIPLFMMEPMKWESRDRRPSYAITSVAPVIWQCCMAVDTLMYPTNLPFAIVNYLLYKYTARTFTVFIYMNVNAVNISFLLQNLLWIFKG
ncbi:MAG: hypothetical protein A2076_08430 [Geobacteraceae bacterium GWC2_53_11]|nr:MAG: hypothetical protein A2076_08430 [Geobacteraceae bacterium GWC2_53_11]